MARVVFPAVCISLLAGLLPACQATPPAKELLVQDDFSPASAVTFAERWAVEQQPGGTVAVEDGRLVIADAAGCTVWLRQKLTAPIVITFEATVSSRGRVSDLNCFWMASDPARPGDLLAPGHSRDGRFVTYDTLRTYYVGYGGNANTTTRFRRYEGSGARPLLPEHDLGAPKFLLVPDHTYRITLIADGTRARYLRDGEVVFDYTDPAPLTEGWFGFRTVNSRIEIRDFRVRHGSFP
ncbi:MAG: hypothetical protein IAE82_19585 [Opitutaceae bacterium]|nr:hypothetical protein [Opitutaceae bacterium]